MLTSRFHTEGGGGGGGGGGGDISMSNPSNISQKSNSFACRLATSVCACMAIWWSTLGGGGGGGGEWFWTSGRMIELLK